MGVTEHPTKIFADEVTTKIISSIRSISPIQGDMLLALYFVEFRLSRQVKHDVYGKRQAAKMKLLPSIFSSLYSRIKILVFAVKSKRLFSIFV